MLKTVLVAAILATTAITTALAQTARGSAPDITGTWEVDTPEGKQRVVVRPDSTASFGEETIRWRIHGSVLYLAFGDEWIGYDFRLKNGRLILSGGDLEEPVTMRRIGPSTPLPKGVAVPQAPPFTPISG